MSFFTKIDNFSKKWHFLALWWAFKIKNSFKYWWYEFQTFFGTKLSLKFSSKKFPEKSAEHQKKTPYFYKNHQFCSFSKFGGILRVGEVGQLQKNFFAKSSSTIYLPKTIFLSIYITIIFISLKKKTITCTNAGNFNNWYQIPKLNFFALFYNT